MKSLPYIDAEAVTALLSWGQACDALAGALRGGLDLARVAPRGSVPTAAGELLLMPAESGTAVGFKLLSIAPANPGIGLPRIQGLYTLFDAATLTPRLLIDGAALTSLRTPAVSALAVQHLAVAGASSLTVFGTGPQALMHVQAISAVRPVTTVAVVGRNAARAAELVARLRDQGFAATSGTADSVRNADIVVCATTAAEPLFDGALLTDHACVVAIGSHQATLREVDDRVFRRAARVVVEDRATALREAGDVIQAAAAGALSGGSLLDMTEMLSAPPFSGLSVFKSVGMAWEDLAIAEAIHVRWTAAGGAL